MVAGVRHGNSLVVRRVSPGRINVVLLIRTKLAVPCQLKPGILKLTNYSKRRFAALSCGEKSRKPSATRVPQRNAAKHLHIHLDPCQSPINVQYWPRNPGFLHFD